MPRAQRRLAEISALWSYEGVQQYMVDRLLKEPCFPAPMSVIQDRSGCPVTHSAVCSTMQLFKFQQQPVCCGPAAAWVQRHWNVLRSSLPACKVRLGAGVTP